MTISNVGTDRATARAKSDVGELKAARGNRGVAVGLRHCGLGSLTKLVMEPKADQLEGTAGGPRSWC